MSITITSTNKYGGHSHQATTLSDVRAGTNGTFGPSRDPKWNLAAPGSPQTTSTGEYNLHFDLSFIAPGTRVLSAVLQTKTTLVAWSAPDADSYNPNIAIIGGSWNAASDIADSDWIDLNSATALESKRLENVTQTVLWNAPAIKDYIQSQVNSGAGYVTLVIVHEAALTAVSEPTGQNEINFNLSTLDYTLKLELDSGGLMGSVF